MPNSIYSRTKASLEHLLGVYFYRRRHLPTGVRLDEDLRRYLPHVTIKIAFDVGANVGQSAERYLRWFEDADVYCFEPVQETFTELSRKMAGRSRVHCHRLAVGARSGLSSVVPGKTSDLAFIPNEDELRLLRDRAQATPMVTLDAFCDAEHVDRIDFLKIDTEGHDLAVLKGCERLLAGQRIGIIQMEAGMTPANRKHVPFDELTAHLQRRDYSLFGLYEQVHEWTAHSAFLRRADPVFVSRRVVEGALVPAQ